MCEIYRPEGISWEIQALIQQMIQEYEEPNEEQQDEFDPFNIPKFNEKSPEEDDWEYFWC